MNDIPLFPVAAITVGPVPSHGLVTIRLDFLTNAMQKPEEAQAGRHYALTPAQAQYVVEKMSSALRTLETSASQGAGLPKH